MAWSRAQCHWTPFLSIFQFCFVCWFVFQAGSLHRAHHGWQQTWAPNSTQTEKKGLFFPAVCAEVLGLSLVGAGWLQAHVRSSFCTQSKGRRLRLELFWHQSWDSIAIHIQDVEALSVHSLTCEMGTGRVPISGRPGEERSGRGSSKYKPQKWAGAWFVCLCAGDWEHGG